MEQSQFVIVGDTVALRGTIECYEPMSGTIEVKITEPPAGSEEPVVVEDLGSQAFEFTQAGDYTIQDDIYNFTYLTDTAAPLAWQVKLIYTIQEITYTETRYSMIQVRESLPSLNFVVRNEKVEIPG